MAADQPRAQALPEPYATLAQNAGEAATRALAAALARGDDPASALLQAGVPDSAILQSLARRHGLQAVAYDERLSVPVELVAQVDQALLADGCWFPLGFTDSGAVIVAVCAPGDLDTEQEVAGHFQGDMPRYFA